MRKFGVVEKQFEVEQCKKIVNQLEGNDGVQL